MAQASRKRAATDAPVIPDRLYFKIGDVARICGIETYVLRFWETQFPQLKPNKSGTGQRLYRRRDVELAVEIDRLVHKQGYTLAGARQALEGGARRAPVANAAEAKPEMAVRATDATAPRLDLRPDLRAVIQQARAELREISALLGSQQVSARRERGKVLKVRPDSDSLFPL
ncbi:MAG TPA: MerR family transcriptional regulator [Terracidiphilus sp.]|nr:MerR family transcriptional regulator [Terracidiphilus sp.]